MAPSLNCGHSCPTPNKDGSAPTAHPAQTSSTILRQNVVPHTLSNRKQSCPRHLSRYCMEQAVGASTIRASVEDSRSLELNCGASRVVRLAAAGFWPYLLRLLAEQLACLGNWRAVRRRQRPVAPLSPARRCDDALSMTECDGREVGWISLYGFSLIRSTSFRSARHEGRWWIIMGKICRTIPFLSIK